MYLILLKSKMQVQTLLWILKNKKGYQKIYYFDLKTE